MYRCFVVTSPGLETIAQNELASLGISAQMPKAIDVSGKLEEDTGGVEFDASLAVLYQVNLHLRSANRIIVRLGDFYAAAFSELRKKAGRLPWEEFLRPDQPVSLRVSTHKSRLYHVNAVAERVAGAIMDRLGAPVRLEKFDEAALSLPQLVVVRLVHDHCTISIDSSGELLHRRGYRLETAKAPLRETLAAGLLLISGWEASSPLLDPFCGSGTIPIEAALMMRRIAPGKNRRFAFMDWPNYNSELWKAQLDEAVSAEMPASRSIFGSDRDAGAIRIAQANAGRAGVLDDIDFSMRAFSSVEPPEDRGWLVTNPPYGMRVSPANDLRNLYSRLGDVLRTHLTGWQVGILCNSDYLIGHTRMRFEQTYPLLNGGVRVKFYTGRVNLKGRAV